MQPGSRPARLAALQTTRRPFAGNGLRLRRRAVEASYGAADQREDPALLTPSFRFVAPHRWRGWHRLRSGQRWGVGWGSVSSFGTPHQTAPPPVDPATGERGASRRAGGGARRGRRRQEGKGVLPSEPQAAAALEEGLALAQPRALSPTRRRTNYSPKTPAPHPRQPVYDHKGIHGAQKAAKSSPQLAKSLHHALVVVAG